MNGPLTKAALGAAFAVSLALPLVGAAPVPPAVAGIATGSLPGGGRYLVSHSDSAPVAAVALWYRAPSSGFTGDPIPGLGQLAAATVAASEPITGTPFGRYVQEIGGRLAVTDYPDSIAISALVPSDRVAATIRAMTASFFTPVVSEAGLKVAQADIGTDALIHAINPEDYIGDSLTAALFADGPAHYPALGSAKAITSASFDVVKAYAERAFRPANAVLVVTGDVDPDAAVAAAVPGNASAAPGAEPPLPARAVVAPSPVATTADEAGIGEGWIGPSIADERDATALDFLADYLFRPDTGVVQKKLIDSKTSVTGKFVTYHDPGVVLVTLSGGDVPAAKAIVDASLKAARTPLDRATFNAARNAFMYHMLSDLQTPGELADTFGWYTVEGNPAYAPGAGGATGTYFAIVQSLTPQFVAQTVQKYLGRPGAVVLVSPKTAGSSKS